MSIYDELERAAKLDPEHALIRITTSYEPAGGPNARVFPPTYPVGPRDEHPYVIEPRLFDGQERQSVLLDSVPSEANRVEEALLRAWKTKRIQVPIMLLEHNAVTLSSLEAPHRYADAYLRDSLIGGVAFDKSDVGAAILASTQEDASKLYEHDPGSLVYGAWNSHRKGKQARFPRVYESRIDGWDPQLGRRKAGRMDPLNLQGAVVGSGESWEHQSVLEKASARKEKGGVRLSEIGHGNIAPSDAHGGVTINGATRTATLSFAALDRLGFGAAPDDAQVAARAALAAYAMLGDRLAFGGGSLWLRSGCELLVIEEVVEWVGRGGTHARFELTSDEAVALFDAARDRAQASGLSMNLEPIALKPNKALADAIDFSLTRAAAED
jgi:CRISPR-associated protein Csb1